jgi:hypothetical protein
VINVNSKQIFAKQCIQKSNLQQNHRGKSRYKQPLKPNLRGNLKRKLEKEKKRAIYLETWRLENFSIRHASRECCKVRSASELVVSLGVGDFMTWRYLRQKLENI